MARDDAALNDVLAQIYLELHLAASGKIKGRDFSNSKLTREQAAILAPIGKDHPLNYMYLAADN